MKLIALLFFAFTAWAQQPSGPAATKGTCSPAVTGNNNTFSISCGIGKEQGAKMLEILNKILDNQLDPEAVMKKLDEILRAVNPNLPAKTYTCDGQWKIVGPSERAALEVQTGGDDSTFQEMARLNNTRKFRELLTLCLSQIRAAPEWLTPRLFCSVAYLNLGEEQKGREMLKEYDSKIGPAYDTDGCKQLYDFLHARVH